MGLRVLSLFDGIACGMQAFKELRTPIDVYYASEIDKPIGYTACIGEGGQRKRTPLIGNGWCVPVIKHIFSFIPKEDNDEK